MIYDTQIPSYIRNEAVAKVTLLTSNLVVKPEWLMIKMMIESGIKPDAHNFNGGASGLIGFMPSTAISLGTTVELLRSMDIIEQLDYVYKYFLPYKGQMNSYFDLSLVDFFPEALGKPDNWIFHSSDNLSAATIVKYNPTFDLNHDNAITITEYKQYELSKVPSLALSFLKEVVTKQSVWIVPVILFTIGLSILHNYNKN